MHLIPSFHQGGSEKQALQLIKQQLRHASDNVRVACLDSSGILRTEAEALGLSDIPEFKLNSFYDRNAAVQFRRFARFVREHRIQIIQTHDFYTNVFGMFAAAAAGVGFRLAAKRETVMRTRAQNFVERKAFRLAQVIVANSLRVKDYLREEGVPAMKIEVVHNGIDLSRFIVEVPDRRDLLRSLSLPHDAGRVVTIVANLREKVKNYPMFIDAAARIAHTNDDVIFVSAGEGPLIDRMKDLARQSGLGDKMHFLGRCLRVPELLAISDVCVLTSVAEGFSNSILEYMAAGKPVVATDVGGAREAVVEDKTGFLVASGASAALADRVLVLLNDAQRARGMGESGRKRVEAEFSADVRLAKTLALYDRMRVPAG